MASTNFEQIIFSTDNLPRRERVPLWHDAFGRTMLRVEVKSHSSRTGNPLCARAILQSMKGLRTVSCQSSAIEFLRTPSLVADGNDDLSLWINLDGTTSAMQCGRDVTLKAGDATLLTCDCGRVKKLHGRRWAAVTVPHQALASLVRKVDDAHLKLVLSNTPALRLLIHYLAAGQDELPLAPVQLLDSFATHMMDLIALAIGATRDGADIAENRGGRAARLAIIKADILASLDQYDYTIAMVAARQGISPRSIQMLFESAGSTFSEYLLSERLSRAHRMLNDVACERTTISTIAFEAGFGDLSYFNRTFRRRYNATPSDVRQAAIESGNTVSAVPRPLL